MQILKGNSAIVTGAGAGIGAAVAAELVRRGMNVMLADIREDSLAAACEQLSNGPGKVAACVTDVSDAESVNRLAKEAQAKFGKVHLAFNNAGVAMHGTAMVDIPLQDWQWVVDVNMFGVIHCIKAFTPLLLQHGEEAHIVNTASIGGLQVNRTWNTGAYSMTKYAAVALSEALRNELRGTNVGVSVLCPGAVDTRLNIADTRPARLGGPKRHPQDALLKAALEAGASPQRVASLLVRAIADKQFYVFTDSVMRSRIIDRFTEIDQGFAYLERMSLTNPG